MINDPGIILADEPFSNIDIDHVKLVIDIIAGLKKRGKTIIAAVHDSQPGLEKLIDRTVYFKDGRISG